MKQNVALTIIAALVILFSGAIVYNYSNFKEKKIEKKTDIHELISLRNNYQDEYDLLENEWFLRNLKENGKYCDKQYNSLYSTYEEFQRHKTLKDSIEILNVMINNYQF